MYFAESSEKQKSMFVIQSSKYVSYETLFLFTEASLALARTLVAYCAIHGVEQK